jgi:hypothetical protein
MLQELGVKLLKSLNALEVFGKPQLNLQSGEVSEHQPCDFVGEGDR